MSILFVTHRRYRMDRLQSVYVTCLLYLLGVKGKGDASLTSVVIEFCA